MTPIKAHLLVMVGAACALSFLAYACGPSKAQPEAEAPKPEEHRVGLGASGQSVDAGAPDVAVDAKVDTWVKPAIPADCTIHDAGDMTCTIGPRARYILAAKAGRFASRDDAIHGHCAPHGDGGERCCGANEAGTPSCVNLAVPW